MQSFFKVIIILLLANFKMFAQAKPMAAFRYGIEWHFFDTENRPMFPLNKNIAPQMVSAYFFGWCKVGLPTVKEGEISVRDAVINEKGIEIPLKELKDNWIISGVDRVYGENILFLANYETGNFASMNQKGKMVPSSPLYYWNGIGEGIGAGYGKLKNNPEEAAIQEFPEFGTETDYEIWDIPQAKLLFRIKGFPAACSEGLISIKQGNLWGFADKKGKWAVKPQFEEIGTIFTDGFGEETEIKSFRSGALCAKKATEWGLISKKGKWLLDPVYTDVSYAGEGYWCFMKEDSEWILADSSGNILKFSFQEPLTVTSGLLYFSDNDGYKIVSLRDKWELQFENAPNLLGAGYFAVQSENGILLYSDKGKMIKKLEYEISEYGKFSNGLLAVLTETDGDSKITFFDKMGNTVIKPGLVKADKSGILPMAMDGFIHVFTGDAHIFYNHRGDVIKEESMEGKWDMMTVLQDNNAGFWAPK